MLSSQREYDIIIAGGGISGVAIAYGLISKNSQLKIAVLDSPTETDRASRTNVGLVWCQSKFLDKPHYAKWGFLSRRLFPELLQELKEVSGIQVPAYFEGGVIPVLSEQEYTAKGEYIEGLRQALGEYRGNMIDRTELEKKLPKIPFGPEVCGAAWCEEDGFLNPLALLRAYRLAIVNSGVEFFNDTVVYSVEPKNNAYTVHTQIGELNCERLVLACGLANKRLAQFAVNDLPVYADKGQVLLTERLPFVMPVPVLGCTQTVAGTVIIGFKHETRGHDATVIPHAVAQEGAWALRVWPELGSKRIIRSWPGLRVMPKDKVAIYSHLPQHENVTLINTHSAVTMAAAHTRYVADYVLGNDLHECAKEMTLKRFGFAI